MTRAQLEHLIRAAAVIAADDTVVVIGSQAILGQFPSAPKSMRTSMEADVFPWNHPERADLIDGFLRAAARHRLAKRRILLQRLLEVEIDPSVRGAAQEVIERAFARGRGVPAFDAPALP